MHNHCLDYSTGRSATQFSVNNPVYEHSGDITAISQTNDAAGKLDVKSYNNVDDPPFESVEVSTKKSVDTQSHSVIDIETLQALTAVAPYRFKKYTVGRDCELREYIEKDLGLLFQRGCAFYEFQHEVENIIESEDKELISQEESSVIYYNYIIDIMNNKITISQSIFFIMMQKEQYFSHRIDKRSLQVVGYKELWYNPNHTSDTVITKVFIQSIGSGARYLPAGSTLLYEVT